MQRKEFIHQCGLACLGVIGLGAVLESCSTTRAVKGQISDKTLRIPLEQFAIVKGGQTSYKRYLIIRNEALNYPIVVYRQSAAEYTALLLRCTHQYNELNVSGELLTCPAHGSEFNTRGEPTHGPAEAKLRQFTTHTDAQTLYIDLA